MGNANLRFAPLIPDPLLTARAYEPSYRSMDQGSVGNKPERSS